jgi:hypothetical protein
MARLNPSMLGLLGCPESLIILHIPRIALVEDSPCLCPVKVGTFSHGLIAVMRRHHIEVEVCVV